MYIVSYRISIGDSVKIFERYKDKVIIADHIDEDSAKWNYCYYDGKDRIWLREVILRNMFSLPRILDKYDYTSLNLWCCARVDDAVDAPNRDKDGRAVYYEMLNLLETVYSEDEIEERFSMFESEYDYDMKQYHYTYMNDTDKIALFHNCSYYDINSAHGDALREIFPKAEHIFKKLYEERKIKPENKMLFNYFVGYLCRVGHRKTYNWIVQRTTTKLKNAIKQLYIPGKTRLIYANTDGFIIQGAKELDNSRTIGDFKMEMDRGDVYLYSNTLHKSTYTLLSFGDEMKGNVQKSIRSNFDLKNGQVAFYNRRFIEFANSHKKGTGYYIIENLEISHKEIIEP